MPAASGAGVVSAAPPPPRYFPSAEHLAAPLPKAPLPEVDGVTTVIPPVAGSEQLSPLDRRARTIDNLRRIGAALNAYVAKYGALPPQAIQNENGERTLSWRVAILPQLGHEALYRQFRLHEPWDSPHNSQLASQIPPEFMSPERRDGSTNYLAVVGPDTAFGGLRGPAPGSFEDGAENTAIIVEADDEHAVAWTKPADFPLQGQAPRSGLGALRGDGVLAVLADGRVVSIGSEVSNHVLAAVFTTDHGEPVAAAQVLKQPTLEARPAVVSTVDPLDELLPSATSSEAPVSAASLLSAANEKPRAGLLPVPDEASLAASRELLKELYKKQVEEARSPEKWAKVIPMLLAEAPKVEANPSDYFELLRIVRDMAAAGGDAASALKAVDLLEAKFQIDALAMRLKAYDDLLKAARSANAPANLAATLSQQAKELMLEAVDRDDYVSAQKAYQQLFEFTKLKGDRAEIQRVTQTKPALEAAQKAFAGVPEAIKRLDADPNDAAANELVGRYLCLVKGRWHDGLPLLVRGADVNLRVVATIDLESGRSPQQTMSLADKYWAMADDFKHPLTRNLHLRAIHCYQQAAALLTGGLEKVKAQKRLEEAQQLYGAEEVTKALQRMAPAMEPAVEVESEG
jgi:tetratricopeptide (TPR) repeat protein